MMSTPGSMRLTKGNSLDEIQKEFQTFWIQQHPLSELGGAGPPTKNRYPHPRQS